jgi:hypothetical protein
LDAVTRSLDKDGFVLRYISPLLKCFALLFLAGTTMAEENMPVGGFFGSNGKQYHFFDNQTYNSFKLSDGNGVFLYGKSRPTIENFPGFPQGKKLSGVMSNPINNKVHYFFFDDGTYGRYQLGDGKDEMLAVDNIEWNWNGWPKEKKIAALINHPSDSLTSYIFFQDGTYGRYNYESDKISYIQNVKGQWNGFPAETPIIGALNHPFDKKTIYFFFKNGTYGRYQLGGGKDEMLYIRGYTYFNDDLMSSVLESIEWIHNDNNIADSEGKNIITASTITVPTNYINAWQWNGIVLTLNGKDFDSQNTFSMSSSNEALLRLDPLINNAFEVMGKPGVAEIIITRNIDKFVVKRLVVKIEDRAQTSVSIKSVFNKDHHKITSIRINRGSEGRYRNIYANGNMQAPINIELEVQDKATGVLVEVLDMTANDNLINLYDLHTGPGKNNQSYLGWGGSEGDNYDKHWRVSRDRNDFDLATYNALSSQQPMAEADQDEPASTASAGGDMVNRYTYYVTTTEAADKIICANVGDVYYSCENGQDEFSKINSITKKSYSYGDFIDSSTYFSSSFKPIKIRLIKLTPRSGFYIKKIKDQGKLKYDGERLVMQGAKNTIQTSSFSFGDEAGFHNGMRSNVWYAVKPGLENVSLSIPYLDRGWSVYNTPALNTDDGSLYLIESSKDGTIPVTWGDRLNVNNWSTANPSVNNGKDTTYVKDIEGWDRYGNPFVIYLRDKGSWDLNIYNLP